MNLLFFLFFLVFLDKSSTISRNNNLILTRLIPTRNNQNICRKFMLFNFSSIQYIHVTILIDIICITFIILLVNTYIHIYIYIYIYI